MYKESVYYFSQLHCEFRIISIISIKNSKRMTDVVMHMFIPGINRYESNQRRN